MQLIRILAHSMSSVYGIFLLSLRILILENIYEIELSQYREMYTGSAFGISQKCVRISGTEKNLKNHLKRKTQQAAQEKLIFFLEDGFCACKQTP